MLPAPADPGRSLSPLLVGPAVAIVVTLALAITFPDVLKTASPVDFVLVTLLLGGGAAWRTGKAVARGWGPYSHLVIYGALLTGAVRFCHFALFEDELFAAEPAAVEFVLLLSIASLGFRALRRTQMTVQYGWMYEAAGPLSWRARTEAAPPAS